MSIHTLPLNRSTLHGHFSNDVAPVLRIADGDTVRFATLDASWKHHPTLGHWQPDFERDPQLDSGHAICGPIFVEGAKPGMTLEIQIGELLSGRTGWTGINPRLGLERVGVAEPTRLEWEIDGETRTATNQLGHTIAVAPFMGVMGNAPAADGIHSTIPPRRVGGNMDCKELVSGSTLWLPIEVEGALFSVGDGHAAQGDGEVCGTAIECPMQLVELTFRVRDDLKLKTPRALTPAGLLVMGFDADLNQATDEALNGALDVIEQKYHVSRAEAFALASIIVDLRVTQIVNQVRGVHAMVRDLLTTDASAR